MENLKNEESRGDDENILVPKTLFYFGAASLALDALTGAAHIGNAVGKMRPPSNLEGPFEIEYVTRTDITLGQEGKKYVLKIDKLPEEVKASLIKQNPELASFLTNGPIKILNVEKEK